MVLKVDSTFSDNPNALAEKQYNYAFSIEKDARQQKSIEGLQEAVREYKKVFFYPDAIEWVYKSFHNIEEIIDTLMGMGDYHKPEGNRFVLPLIEECQQTIQNYLGTNEAAIAQFTIGNIIRSQHYQYWKGGYAFKEVTEAFQRVVDNYSKSPLVPHAMMEIANSYDLTGYTIDDSLKAIAIYQQIIQDYPDTLYAIIAQMCIGTEYENKGYCDEDPEYYRKAIEEITKVITDMSNIKYWDSDAHTWAREEIKRILSDVVSPEPYTYQPEVIFSATIQLQPDKWNIAWIKKEEHPGEGQLNCYIGNIKDYTVEDIDVESVKLNATLPAENPQIINKHPGFTGKVLRVKFNKFEAIKGIQEPAPDKEYEVMVYGTLSDGKLFYGISTVQIIGDNRK